MSALTFSPDGRWIICGGEDGEIKVYESQTVRQPSTIQTHSVPVIGTMFTLEPDRMQYRLLLCGANGILTYCDLASLSEIGRYNLAIRVRCCALSVVSIALVAGDGQGNVLVLSLEKILSSLVEPAPSSEEDAAQSSSEDISYLIRQGLQYAERRQYEEALDSFAQALKLRPDDPRTFINRGGVYY